MPFHHHTNPSFTKPPDYSTINVKILTHNYMCYIVRPDVCYFGRPDVCYCVRLDVCYFVRPDVCYCVRPDVYYYVCHCLLSCLI